MSQVYSEQLLFTSGRSSISPASAAAESLFPLMPSSFVSATSGEPHAPISSFYSREVLWCGTSLE